MINVTLKKFFSSSYVMSIILAVILCLLNYDFFVTYWSSPVVPGWDGSSHAAIGKYYAENIFPKTWGWVPNWFAGMPFPQFYPPLFYFITALIFKVLPFAYEDVFKTFLLLITVLLPGLVYYVSITQIKSKSSAFMAGLISVFFLSSYSNLDFKHYGISIESTFNDGMVTQILAFVFLLLWLNHFLKFDESKKNKNLSTFFLFLILISNVHIVPVAGILFITIFLFRVCLYFKNSNSIRKIIKYASHYLIYGCASLLLSSFWYLPLVSIYKFSPAKALPIDNLTNVFFSLLPVIFLIVTSAILSYKCKQKNIFILSFSLLFLYIVTMISNLRFFTVLPFHTDRWIGPIIYLSPIVIGYVFIYAMNYLQNKWPKIILCGASLLLLYSYTLINPQNYRGFYFDSLKDRMGEQIKVVTEDSYLSTVESTFPHEQSTFSVFNSLLGENKDMTYIVFRESSISSIFLAPLRNTFSLFSECWNNPSTLCFDKDYINQPIKQKLERADFMGVNYFWVRSKKIKDELLTSPADKIAEVGGWSIYKNINNQSGRALALDHEPILLFSMVDFKTSDKDQNQYNYVRLNEELLFNNHFDTIFASALDNNLDSTSDLNRFKIAVISEYKYNDIDNAFERLQNYAINNYLVLIESKDPLFTRLSNLGLKNIKIISRSLTNQTPELFRKEVNDLFSYLEKIKIPITERPSLSIDIEKNILNIFF